jgi:hypothetical protein
LIEKSPTFSEKDLLNIRNKLRSYLGKNMKIEFQIVDRIPPDKSGKLWPFVSEIDLSNTPQGNTTE